MEWRGRESGKEKGKFFTGATCQMTDLEVLNEVFQLVTPVALNVPHVPLGERQPRFDLRHAGWAGLREHDERQAQIQEAVAIIGQGHTLHVLDQLQGRLADEKDGNEAGFG